MKKLLFILLLLPFVSRAQFAIDAGLSSHNTRLSNLDDDRFNQLGLNASMRALGRHIYAKVFFRQLLPKSNMMYASYEEEEPTYGYMVTRFEPFPVTYAETTFGLGFGFTTGSPATLTRPYLGLDIGRTYHNIKFDYSGPARYVQLADVPRTDINKKKIQFESMVFKLVGGFQFNLTPALLLYNEAAINFYNNGSNETGFCIDLGVRYFFR